MSTNGRLAVSLPADVASRLRTLAVEWDLTHAETIGRLLDEQQEWENLQDPAHRDSVSEPRHRDRSGW